MFVGIGGGLTADSRFKRLASVGLIVLAPSPLIRPEAMDWRLLPEDEVGVVVRLIGGFPGERAVVPFASASLPPGGILLTFACRDCVVAVKVDTRGISAPADVDGCTTVRLPAPKLPLRTRDGLVDSGGTGGPSCCGTGFLSMKLLKRPGPMDFLGAFVLLEGIGWPNEEELCGTVDCLLVRSDTVGCPDAGGSLVLFCPTATLVGIVLP